MVRSIDIHKNKAVRKNVKNLSKKKLDDAIARAMNEQEALKRIKKGLAYKSTEDRYYIKLKELSDKLAFNPDISNL